MPIKQGAEESSNQATSEFQSLEESENDLGGKGGGRGLVKNHDVDATK